MSGERRSKRLLALAVLLGVAGGLGAYTFQYASGLSYLSTDPKACKSCHIMNEEFDAWRKGPHHAAATCYDCHLPLTFPEKYLAKARNGWNHSVGFTFQPSSFTGAEDEELFFEEPIRIKDSNSRILQDNCLRCHGDLVHEVVRGSTWADDAIRCVHCHRGVGHGAAG